MKNRYLAGLLGLLLAAALVGCQPAAPPAPLSPVNVQGSEKGTGKDAKLKTTHSAAYDLLKGPIARTVAGDGEGHNWKVRWRVDKWHLKDARAIRLAEARGLKPYEVVDAQGNILLTAGITRMLNLLVGAGGQALDNTHARIGTGNGSTAVVIGDTDLSAAAGSTNRWFQMMDSTFPSVVTNVATFKATFASGDGNYTWSEFGIDAGMSSGNTVTAPLLNRKVQALGTKASGSAWAITVTLTVS